MSNGFRFSRGMNPPGWWAPRLGAEAFVHETHVFGVQRGERIVGLLRAARAVVHVLERARGAREVEPGVARRDRGRRALDPGLGGAQRGGEALVRDRARPRPPRPPQHVVPVRVAEQQGHGLRSPVRDPRGDVVELRGQHPGVHDHGVARVEQHQRVHRVGERAADLHALPELGPRGRGAHGARLYSLGATIRPATISRSSESTVALIGAGMRAWLWGSYTQPTPPSLRPNTCTPPCQPPPATSWMVSNTAVSTRFTIEVRMKPGASSYWSDRKSVV